MVKEAQSALDQAAIDDPNDPEAYQLRASLALYQREAVAGKAPDSLLRLGQSLAALNQKEAACATLAEVERKFPRASASVKRGVTAEQKKVRC